MGQECCGTSMKRADRHGSGTASPVPARRRRVDPTAPIVRRARRPLPEFTGLLARKNADAGAGFTEFLPVALQIVHTPPSRIRRMVAYALCATITVALLASIFGHLTLFAIAPGELVVRGGSQVVQSVEAGQVTAIPVGNGSHVERGSVVLQLDPTAAQAAKAIIEAKLAYARAEAARHGAAASAAQASAIDKASSIPWPSGLPEDLRAREEAVFHADLAQLAATIVDLQDKSKTQEAIRGKYEQNIAAQTALIGSRTKRTAMHQTLEKQGWDSRATVLQALQPLRQDEVGLATYRGLLGEAKAEMTVIDDEIAQTRANFVADNIDAMAAAERQIPDLVERLKTADLALADLTLRAPVSGTVQALAVTNLGQSIAIGETLMQVTSDGVPLEVTAYVVNADIGFVKAGQSVNIKVDTFPYTRYGTIEGRVTRVGADAFAGRFALMQQKDDATAPSKGSLSATNAAEQTTDLVFPVTVVPNKLSIAVEGRDVPLTAGMSVVAEIETQRQRAIDYILYPLTRVFNRDRPQGGGDGAIIPARTTRQRVTPLRSAPDGPTHIPSSRVSPSVSENAR